VHEKVENNIMKKGCCCCWGGGAAAAHCFFMIPGFISSADEIPFVTR